MSVDEDEFIDRIDLGCKFTARVLFFFASEFNSHTRI
jgi:hypothetical protein